MSEAATSEVDRFVSDADANGPGALPRKNGELDFEEPWESRAFGLAVTLGKESVFEWEEFRQGLISEIAVWEEQHRDGDGDVDSSEWSYYERWLASLERVLLDRRVLSEDEVQARMERIAHEEAHEHDHESGHHHD